MKRKLWHTTKTGRPEHGTRNTGATPAEQRNTGRAIGTPRNSGICEEQRSNITTKQDQEILPI